MRKLELTVISELMKNSRISDRELAKKIGKSQPTITRIRRRLEKEGYIREYSMLPDLSKLGYELMALTFVRSRARAKKSLAAKITKASWEN
ncbi:MAG: winged helix-turn-helix transcriptional regulator [Candidatus Bathyarchaeota archaeon]|jgi:DNA-binding Lrp family transcriptional regulator